VLTEKDGCDILIDGTRNGPLTDEIERRMTEHPPRTMCR
jgi:hypothetical protein